MSDPSFDVAAAHAHFARSLHGETWTLLEQPERTEVDKARMLDAAHASAYHWRHAGGPVNEQRGEWLISRVNAVLGAGRAALHHAERAHMLFDAHRGEMAEFDEAFVHEALARAHAAVGDATKSDLHHAAALAAADHIADDHDKEILLEELAREPWFGVR